MWISRKKFADVKKQVADLNGALIAAAKEIDMYQDASVLIGIERSGAVNKFTFMRNGKQIEIQTYSTISDPLPQWKEELLR